MKLPIFQLESVSYEQQDVTILDDISWCVAPGQHWAILGPNGSGKTTLLKVATGYLWHTSGRVLRGGVELQDLGEFRRQIGWISADIISLIPPSETALETVVSGRFAQFGLKYLQCTTPTSDDFNRARAELERTGLQSLAQKPFRVLSQGERQQVLVARTRMAGQTLLVLDEPCAGMDPGIRERFLSWLEEHLRDPSFPAVLFVTHHVEGIVPGIEHALLITAGRLHSSGHADEVITQAALEQIYSIPLLKLENHHGRRWPLWRL